MPTALVIPWEAGHRLKHLDQPFRTYKLGKIDSTAITVCVTKRRRQGSAAATVNVELATLHRRLASAQEQGRLTTAPTIRYLKPNPPRSGLLESSEVESICHHLPDDLQLAMRIAYTFGWRIVSEVLTLARRQVD